MSSVPAALSSRSPRSSAIAGPQLPDELAGGLLPTVAWQRADGATVYALDGGVYDAGSAIDWVRETGLLGDHDGFDAIDAPPAVDRGVVFVPALSGLACPHWDRTASGTWIGIHHGTTGTDLALAVLEGVALLTADVLDLMAAHAASSGPVSVDGGLVRSRRFCEFLASAIQRPVRVPAAIELTLLGAALLAAGDDHRGSRDLPARVHEPVDADVGHWRQRFTEAVIRARGWRT